VGGRERVGGLEPGFALQVGERVAEGNGGQVVDYAGERLAGLGQRPEDAGFEFRQPGLALVDLLGVVDGQSGAWAGTRQADDDSTSGPRLGPYPASSSPTRQGIRSLATLWGTCTVSVGPPMLADNIFLKILNKQIPARIAYEDDRCLAFHDVNPQAPVHVLVIPRKVIPTADDLTEADRETVGHLHLVAAKLAKELGLSEGYRLVINCKGHGGQTVPHLHLHLLGGRPFGWPPG
jgi:histidine triad (HIT) family protein